MYAACYPIERIKPFNIWQIAVDGATKQGIVILVPVA